MAKLKSIIQVNDINAVQVRCANCSYTIILSPCSAYQDLPNGCPSCSSSKWTNLFPDKTTPEEELLRGLERALNANPPSKHGVTLSFELDVDASP